MCGICGIWDPTGVDERLMRSMNTALLHRGPDDEGYYYEGPIGLGHRRLSVIDLEHGRQPISNEDGTVWIVFNGEIYNFAELRQVLEAAGHRFKTMTDTEVIVHLYEQHGTDCIHHLRGMFAFAVWDGRHQRLFLARDHVGQKSLFFHQAGRRFAFASEIKALLRLDQINAQLNSVAMNHLISLRYAPDTQTLFKGIQKLPAGHSMIVENGHVSMHRYWRPDYIRKLSGGEEEISDVLRGLLRDAVRSHLISDVPVGAFLSGGIDSSTVVAMMAAASTDRVHTFSIGVKEADFNELGYARLVAQRYGTAHHEHIADDELLRVLPRLIWHMDEIADPFGFGVYLVAQLAKQHVKVVLGGDGGDELFAGYDRYAGNRLVDYYCFLPAPLRRRLFPALIRLLPDSYTYNSATQRLRWLHEMSLTSGGHRYASSMSYLRFPQEMKERLFTASLRKELADDFDSSAHVVNHFDTRYAEEVIDKMLYTDMMTRMPESLLRLVDHMTMAHGLEDRSPLLDRRLVEFAAAISPGLKIRGGRLKYIFKRVAKDFLPATLLSRPKQGFSFPLAYWMRGELGGLIEGLLLGSRLAEEGYFRRDYMLELLQQHRAGLVDHNYRLWILLNLELWWRMYLDGMSVDSLEQLMHLRLHRQAA
ncbi:MAG TPA: asparagine synthase (glutamine-hydrolyzing) [Candidatus Binatia bacterium]|nr:asparagine synthase (glutamine-hydrolyzing) [Candidatus Binatia bacterium]